MAWHILYHHYRHCHDILMLARYQIIFQIIISTFALIFLRSNITVPELLMFSVGAQDAILGLMLSSIILSKVYTDSNGVKEILMQCIITGSGVERKAQERWCVCSMFPLKCYMGYNNYVEKTTPLVLFDFCAGKIVDLLLTQ